MRTLKILLVNERGCFDPGIIAMAKVLSAKHRVVIVGPLQEQEGKGHRINTSQYPLRAERFYALNKVKMFGVNGTPVDCVLLGLEKLLQSKPDLVISGINPRNCRGEVIYSSGVVSAAIEGTIQGIPSIAVSADIKDKSSEKCYMAVAKVFARKLPHFYKYIPKDHTLNVNFPEKFSIRKIKATHLTLDMVNNHYESETNPYGATFFWLRNPLSKGEFSLDILNQQGDVYWLKKGFITFTPLKLDLTDESVYNELKELFD